jgi:predicted DNA-binding transcriptional regulator AlpA
VESSQSIDLKNPWRNVMARKILRLPEIAEKTGVPVATLRWYRHRGLGPKTFLFAGRVVAYEAEVDEWVESARHSSLGVA